MRDVAEIGAAQQFHHDLIQMVMNTDKKQLNSPLDQSSTGPEAAPPAPATVSSGHKHRNMSEELTHLYSFIHSFISVT